MVTTLCQSGVALLKAGTNVSSDFTSDAGADGRWTTLINQAEATIATTTRFDWVANFANVSANFKLILENVCSSMAAKAAIIYDMSGYTGLLEATTMLDVNHDIEKKCIEILRLQENQEKMI